MKKKKIIFKTLLISGILLILISIIFGYQHFDTITQFIVYAQNNQTISLDETMFNIVDILQPTLKLIYILMWPLLVIAGSALDNTFVYGEFLHLDAPLRQMWNMVKNFANFALGFIVLIEIFRFVFNIADKNAIMNVFKGAIIAGVGINASWFIMGAIIDISTIATYSIGGLPMTMIKETKMGETPILGIETTMNLSEIGKKDSKSKSLSILYKRGDYKFLPCQEYKKFVVGPIGGQNKKDPIKGLDNKYCLLQNNFMVDISNIIKQNGGKTINDIGNKYRISAVDDLYNGKYSEGDSKYSGFSLKGVIYYGYVYKDGKIILSGSKEKINPSKYGIITKDELIGKNGIFNRQKEFTRIGSPYFDKGTLLGDLIEDSKGFVGPLVTLYTNLMNLGDLNVTSVGGGGGRTDYATFFEFLIKAITGILLLFPLIAMTIVFIVRIGFLWMYVIASPFIALGLGFSENRLGKKINEYLDIKKIAGLVFSPVISVFALSISILFLFTLQSSFKGQQHNDVRKGLGLEIVQEEGSNISCLNIFGLFETCYDVGNNHHGGSFYIDLFAWLIMNGFGIALVRTIMFMAIKGNKITDNIVKGVKDLGVSAIKATPFLPVPGAGMIGAGALDKTFNIKDGKIRKYINDELYGKIDNDAKKLEEMFNPPKGEEKIIKDINKGVELEKAFENGKLENQTSSQKLDTLLKVDTNNDNFERKISDSDKQWIKDLLNNFDGNDDEKTEKINQLKAAGWLTEEDIQEININNKRNNTKNKRREEIDTNASEPIEKIDRTNLYQKANNQQKTNILNKYKEFVKKKGEDIINNINSNNNISKDDAENKIKEIKERIISPDNKNLTSNDIFGTDKITIKENGQDKEYKINIEQNGDIKLTS